MKQPEPATGWPDRPLDEEEATALFEDGPLRWLDTDDESTTDDTHELDAATVLAVWVMDQDSGVRSAVAPGADEDAVVDIVVETDRAYRMFSFSGGRWMDYGTQRKDDEDAPSMAGTLDSYRVLAGAPENE